MADFLYPPDQSSAQLTADFVLTQANSTVPNGFVLTPGPGIAIVYSGNQVQIENTGTGSTSASNTSTYITKANESSSLANSSQIQNSTTISAVYGTNIVSFIATPSTTANQTLTTMGATAGWNFGDVGLKTYVGGGAITLTSASESTQVYDATASFYTVALPTAVSCPGKVFVMKKIDNSVNQITISAADNIDGNGTYSLVVPNQALTIRSIGSTWIIT